VAVVPGSARDYIGTGHPKSALLIVEISDTTPGYDRHRKASRYARAKYQDYWIVNLNDRCVEVHRQPVADPTARLGWRYSEVSILNASARLKPLAAAGEIAITDLLP
jgi:Uma2 family endonuclease